MSLEQLQATDQAARPWLMADHLDAGVLLVTLRGDW